MIPQAIAGWNAAPGAPKGWDPDRDGPCGALPIRAFPAAALTDPTVPVQTCESAWKPTPDELELLNQGGQVVLRVAGWQPPVSLRVEMPPAELPAEHSPVGSPRCGDHVRHIPTGEDWVVAWCEAGQIAWCGFPNGIAEAADCEILRRANDEEHRQTVEQLSHCRDFRGARAVRLYGHVLEGGVGRGPVRWNGSAWVREAVSWPAAGSPIDG